jgi:hypothetical protein
MKNWGNKSLIVTSGNSDGGLDGKMADAVEQFHWRNLRLQDVDAYHGALYIQRFVSTTLQSNEGENK